MLGVLLNTRGMVELAVLNVGLEAGLITREAFSALVVMAIVTAAMASPIVSRLRAGVVEAETADHELLRR